MKQRQATEPAVEPAIDVPGNPIARGVPVPLPRLILSISIRNSAKVKANMRGL